MASDISSKRKAWTLLRAKAMRCRNCPLYKRATQTVFGEGPVPSRIMMVGEVPGDREDLAGHPFVGPAGKLLERCLLKMGVDRGKVYLTNAVKHFKWEPRGKRRLHQKPNAGEIAACHPWLEEELELVKPRLVVALGATAAQVLMGRSFRVTRERGRLFDFAESKFLATIHPSSLLRMPEADRKSAFQQWVRDLRKIKDFL